MQMESPGAYQIRDSESPTTLFLNASTETDVCKSVSVGVYVGQVANRFSGLWCHISRRRACATGCDYKATTLFITLHHEQYDRISEIVPQLKSDILTRTQAQA